MEQAVLEANSIEPILEANPDRYTMFPIKHWDLWKIYKQAIASIWPVEEINLEIDRVEFVEKLNDAERRYIENILAFFAGADGLVNEALAESFLIQVQYPEARAVYSSQIFIESVHSETYSLLIEELVRDHDRKTELFRGMYTNEATKRKAEWITKQLSGASFVRKLIVLLIIEGIFFSSSFASIFWFRKRGLLPGLCFSNEQISKDEGLHCQTSAIIYNNHIVGKLEDSEINQLFTEATDIEKFFVDDCLKVDLIGMNSKEMKEYVEYIADYWLEAIGHSKIYGTSNPLDFMAMIAVDGKTNFFEGRVGSYQRAGVMEGSKRFALDEEF